MLETITPRDTFRICGTTISFTNNTERNPGGNWLCHKFHHYAYFYRLLNMLASEGFTIQKDHSVKKCIRKDYYIGKRKDLELDAQKYPNGFKIEFFQNIVFENRNGGRYDFDKLEKMPYLIKLQFIKYTRELTYNFHNSLSITSTYFIH